MAFLKKIELNNFMCFRDSLSMDFLQGTYLVGANNSGKSAVLMALRCFFDDSVFVDDRFLNRTKFIGKGAGYNKATICLEFNLDEMQTKTRKQRLVKIYGKEIRITKIFTFREITKTILIEYEVGSKKVTSLENMDPNIKKLIDSVHVTYLHPQEGVGLLHKAEQKLRDRLLLNWGRRGGVTTSLQKFRFAWDELRKTADLYLSKALTQSLQDIWSGSSAKINLPKRAEDIIAISDISFQGSKNLPDIQLTSQGTGAQSMILYLTHFLLDSDRSLHRGEYHPLWLIEEPESFLHADLMFKLGQQLNSKNWLDNIQMAISTHSAIMLASSRLSKDRIQWALLKDHSVVKKGPLDEWVEQDIKAIGSQMGDSNFYIYFLAATKNDLIFVEDTRKETLKVFKNIGIDIVKALGGAGEIKKYLDTLAEISPYMMKKSYIILDRHKGMNDFSRFMHNPVQSEEGIDKFKVADKVFLVILPENCAVEDLFDEFDNFQEECVDKIFKFYKNGKCKLRTNMPQNLSRTSSVVRSKNMPTSKKVAKDMIKNTQDVKNNFWMKVVKDKLGFSARYSAALKKILGE